MSKLIIGGLYKRKGAAGNLATITKGAGGKCYLVWLSIDKREPIYTATTQTARFYTKEKLEEWLAGAEYLGNLSKMLIKAINKVEEE